MGIRSATTNLDNVDAWWGANPDCNIGVVGDSDATDHFLLRVDVDPKRDGHLAWQSLIQRHGDTPTLTVKTPSGGFHYYFTTRQPHGNGVGNLPVGIDIRGHMSGYTVGAGSVTIAIPDKSVAGVYTLECSVAMADAPQWLLDTLSGVKSVDASRDTTTRTEIDAEAFADLRSALLSLPMLQDWRRWSDNGLALRALGDVGRALWCDYSAAQVAACPNKTPGDDTAETWWHRHRPESVKSDYRSIFARAQALGWKNPKSLDTAALGFGVVQQPVTATSSGRKFRLLSEQEFTSGPDPDWRVDGLLPAEGLGMIYGASGIGKSFLNLDILGCISDGRNYGTDSRKTKQGRVIYVVAEGAGGMRQRIRAYRNKYPVAHDNFKIIDAAPNLMNPTDVGEIMQTIMEAGGADVIVFDTMHSCMAGGDENSAKDMGVLLTNARAIQLCIKGLVMFVHHSGKDESRGARGSSAIRAAMDVQIEVSLNPRFEKKRIAQIVKQRDGEDNLAWEFDLEPVIVFGDKPFSSAVVRHIASSRVPVEKPTNKRTSKNQNLVVGLVEKEVERYPAGIPMEVLIATGCRERHDLKPWQVQKLITKSIEEGSLSIDSDANIKLAWIQ